MSKSDEYSKPTISGEGILSIKSSDLVRSKAARRQIAALKNVRLADKDKNKTDKSA